MKSRGLKQLIFIVGGVAILFHVCHVLYLNIIEKINFMYVDVFVVLTARLLITLVKMMMICGKDIVY